MLDADAGLAQDRAQRARRKLAMHGYDDRSPVSVAQLAVTAALAAEYKTGAHDVGTRDLHDNGVTDGCSGADHSAIKVGLHQRHITV